MCRAATINETKALAIPYRARNRAAAAGAGNLTLIDARLSYRLSRYTFRLLDADDEAAVGCFLPAEGALKRSVEVLAGGCGACRVRGGRHRKGGRRHTTSKSREDVREGPRGVDDA